MTAEEYIVWGLVALLTALLASGLHRYYLGRRNMRLSQADADYTPYRAVVLKGKYLVQEAHASSESPKARWSTYVDALDQITAELMAKSLTTSNRNSVPVVLWQADKELP